MSVGRRTLPTSPVQGIEQGGVSGGCLCPSAVDEEGAAEVSEGLEVFGFAFVAADEAAVVEQPGQAGLDDPAVAAKPLGRVDARAGDPDGDAAAADLCPECSLVICLVGVELGGAVPGSASPGANRGERVQQRHHDLRIVDL
jgi:hypothetical protein